MRSSWKRLFIHFTQLQALLKKAIINLLKFLIFLGVGLGILYLVFQKQNAAYQEDCLNNNVPIEDCSLINKILTDFQGANYFWILIVLLAFVVSNFSRAARWRMLLKPLGYVPKFSNAFLSIMIGYFANLGLPRLGEVVRAGTIARYEQIPVEKAMGTIVTDRIVDVLSMLTVVGIAFLLEYDTLWNYISGALEAREEGEAASGGVSWLWIIMGIGVLGVLIAFLFRKQLMQTAIFKKIQSILLGFWEGISSVLKLEKPGLFLLHSINIWLMYYLMTYLCFFAFAPTADLGPVAGLMVFVFGAFGILIPSPGGMGTYHLLVVQALAIYQVSGDDAFSFANIIFFSVQIGCNVLIGLVALLLLPILNRSYEPKHPLQMAAS